MFRPGLGLSAPLSIGGLPAPSCSRRPRVPDGLTISPVPFRKQPDNEAPADLIPDNGKIERMNRTIKDATVKRYLRNSRPAARPPAKLRRRLQLRQTPQNHQGPHPIRIRLQSLDVTASEIQTQSPPPNAGTKQLGGAFASASLALTASYTFNYLRAAKIPLPR